MNRNQPTDPHAMDDSADATIRDAAHDLAAQARERFVGDLQTLTEHAQELLRVTGTLSGQGLVAAREQLMQSLAGIGDSLKGWQHEAAMQTRRAAERADSYVHEHPWPAIGAGVLVGVALGVAGGSLARGNNGSGRH